MIYFQTQKKWGTCFCVNIFGSDSILPESHCDDYNAGYSVYSISDYSEFE